MTQPSLKHPAILLATWFGSGYIKPAPGTWGSFAALPFILSAHAVGGVFWVLAFAVFVTAIGFWAAAEFDHQSGGHDAKEIVIDEVAGVSITLLPVLYFVGLSPLLCIIGFILFRVFDILKPWPVSYCDQQMKGAAGVMLDDVVAGLFAAGCLMGLIYAGIG